LTAEKIFQGVHGYDVRSAGTEAQARIKATAGHIGWADVIFVMEKKHQRRLEDNFSDLLPQKKVVCLNISDDYLFMDRELIDLLVATVSEHIDIPEMMPD